MYKGSRDIESVKTYINDMLHQHGLRVEMDTNVQESETTQESPEIVHSDMFADPDEDAVVRKRMVYNICLHMHS